MHALDAIFRPQSVAVIGASSKDRTIGKEIVRNLIAYEFQGPIFPVNPQAKVVHSIKCYKSVMEIPDPVDLAIIVVPSKFVLQVAEECGQKGIKGLVVITAGFKEIGETGLEREKQLSAVLHKYGMRMIGPNCMGVINTHADIKLDATFAPTQPIPGHVGFMSQSGALGVAILEIARELNLGISMFASMGNKTDISGNDLLEYWRDDPETKMILMYLESFGNPRKFTQIAKSIARTKPIISVKAGRTLQGAAAASSHTGALASSLDVATDAMFEKCGVIRVSSIDELFNLAAAFDAQPLPKDNRIAIVTNAGGPAIMATDALISSGMRLATLEESTKQHLRQHLPPEASANNPVDLIASADEHRYKIALEAVLRDPNVDAVIAIFVPPIMITANAVAQTIIDMHRQYADKPVLSCFMGQQEGRQAIALLRQNKIPVYFFPEHTVYALKAMDQYRRWREKPEGTIKTFDVDRKAVEQILSQAKSENRKQLSFSEVTSILNAYHFPLPAHTTVPLDGKGLKEAVEFSKSTGGSVVLKLLAADLTHKSDVGGVKIDLRTEKEIADAFSEFEMKMKERHIRPDGVLVQEMIKGGKELVLGMNVDKNFGALIMFGLGGIYVEVLKDVSFSIAPITDLEAHEMIKSIKGYPLLTGVRGQMPVNIDAIAEALQRLSQLVTDFPDIREIDINPLLVFHEKEKCKVVDARIGLI
ncbi:acetate--CoA ligase family protein [bacterium]|nr:acetate--CoA ligase family protein [bacterium]